MISDVLRNTARALRHRASQDNLTPAGFEAGMRVLDSVAEQVEHLEQAQMPASLTLVPEDFADGKVVQLRKPN